MGEAKNTGIGCLIIILFFAGGFALNYYLDTPGDKSETDKEVEYAADADQDYIDNHESENAAREEYEALKEQGIYPVGEAEDHIGEYVAFYGHVSEVSQPGVDGDPIFVNIGGSYPNALLTGVCWSEYHSAFEDLKQYEGETVTIKGTVYDYEGTPNIELTDSSQISKID